MSYLLKCVVVARSFGWQSGKIRCGYGTLGQSPQVVAIQKWYPSFTIDTTVKAFKKALWKKLTLIGLDLAGSEEDRWTLVAAQHSAIHVKFQPRNSVCDTAITKFSLPYDVWKAWRNGTLTFSSVLKLTLANSSCFSDSKYHKPMSTKGNSTAATYRLSRHKVLRSGGDASSFPSSQTEPAMSNIFLKLVVRRLRCGYEPKDLSQPTKLLLAWKASDVAYQMDEQTSRSL